MSNILSIDMGTNSIKIALGEFKKSNLSIQKVSSILVPEYNIEKGRLKNPTTLTDLILGFLKSESVKVTNAVFTFNAVGAIVRDIDLPNGKPKELEAMVRNEMVRTYHVDDSDVIQFKALDSFTNDAGATMTTYRTVALDAELVEEYYDFSKQLHFKSIALDINMNSVDKMLQWFPLVNDTNTKEKTVMLIDFGAKSTSIYMHSGGKQRFFRQLEMGSDEIEKRIGDIALIQPSEIKRQKEEGYNFFSADTANENFSSILKPFFYELTDELRTILRFYATRYKAAGIDQILLFGGGSQMAGLPEYLEANLALPVERIQKISNINGNLSEKDLLTHLNAFGAIIRNVKG